MFEKLRHSYSDTMFNRLRNRLVLLVMITTTVILVVAFAAIYIVASSVQNHQVSIPDFAAESSIQEQFEDYLRQRLQSERSASLSNLLWALIVSGLCIELAVFCMALYVAEESIRPIRETYNAQKEFIANASHEIKTPLAAIQANLEAADIQDNHWIDNASAKVEELTQLNNQLLALARAGAVSEASVLETVDLGEFIQAQVAPFEPQIQAKKLKLTITNTEKNLLTRKLCVADLKQIVNILLDNAIKYASHQVEVICAHDQITVKNDGAKISAAQLPHIFERFYQTDKNKAGVGLGLAIAKQAADRNRWHLTAQSGGKFTEFTLKF